MKKVVAFLLCLIFAFSLIGCKSNDETALSSGVSSIVENVVSDNSNTLSSTPSQQENISSDITSNNVPSTPDSKNETTSSTVNSSSGGTTSTPRKPQQTVVDDPNTITAPNGDKIYIELQKGEQPSVMVKVNGKEIYSYSNFTKYADQYDFDKDFTNNVIDEYSDEEILWAYKFNWGVVYAAPYEDQIIYVAGAKHEHEKKTYGTYQYYHLALEMDLIDYKISEYTGEKYYWENLPLAQSFTEYFYKTEDYTIIEIPDWVEAGYDFQEYYEWYNLNVRKGLGSFYELYIGEEKTALLFLSAAEGMYKIQEFGWDSIKTIWVSQGNPHLNAEFR